MGPLVKQRPWAASARAEDNDTITFLVRDSVLQSCMVLAFSGSERVTLFTFPRVLPSGISRSCTHRGVSLVLLHCAAEFSLRIIHALIVGKLPLLVLALLLLNLDL